MADTKQIRRPYGRLILLVFFVGWFVECLVGLFVDLFDDVPSGEHHHLTDDSRPDDHPVGIERGIMVIGYMHRVIDEQDVVQTCQYRRDSRNTDTPTITEKT